MVEPVHPAYLAEMRETQRLLEASGRGYLFPAAIGLTGSESNFGRRNGMNGSNPNKGMLQMMLEDIQTCKRWARANASLFPGGVSPIEGMSETPAEFEGNGRLLAVLTMMNAEHAARALGVNESNLSLEQIYMPHIFGVGGGPAILRAYADNPNTLVSDVHIRVRGKIREAVRPVDYYNNGGHEFVPYEELTVGQLVQFMRERNFQRRADFAPEELRATLVAGLAGNPGSGDYTPPPVYAEAPSRTPTPTRVADAGGGHRPRTPDSTDRPHIQNASYTPSAGESHDATTELNKIALQLAKSGASIPDAGAAVGQRYAMAQAETGNKTPGPFNGGASGSSPVLSA